MVETIIYNQPVFKVLRRAQYDDDANQIKEKGLYSAVIFPTNSFRPVFRNFSIKYLEDDSITYPKVKDTLIYSFENWYNALVFWSNEGGSNSNLEIWAADAYNVRKVEQLAMCDYLERYWQFDGNLSIINPYDLMDAPNGTLGCTHLKLLGRIK